jgi:hypothetical protein
MARKPEGDLGSMAISKAKAADTVPFSAEPEPAAAPTASPDKSLTVKLKGDLYAALRAYCYEQEKAAGVRVTHQDVMVASLKGFLRIRS